MCSAIAVGTNNLSYNKLLLFAFVQFLIPFIPKECNNATCQSAEGMSDARLLLWLPFAYLLYIGLVDANDDHDKVDLQPEYYHLPVVQ